MLASPAGANVWHVNNRASNASDDNPGTEEAPLRTINAASTNENFEAGDTILVHPGIYDEGVVPTAEGPDWPSRVYLPKKTVLTSTGGPGETFIVGRHGSDSYDLGSDAVRCMTISASAAGTVVSNLTICGGATSNADRSYGSGGGVSVGGLQSFIVDCVISNCTAYKGGGTYYGKVVRCRFINNKARGSSTGNCGAAANKSYLLNCVVDGCNGTQASGKAAALSDGMAVNCTVVNCKDGVSTGKYYNMVFSAISGVVNTKGATMGVHTTPDANGWYQVVGSGVNDYRLIVGTGGDEMACEVSYASSQLSMPAEYAGTDYAGNPYPSSGTCLPGAVQATATVKGGGIQASGADLFVDGKRLAAGGYMFAEAWPTQWQISAAPPAGQHLWAFSRAVAQGGRIFPQLDDTAWFMPSPETANVTTTQPLFATVAYWVNPDESVGSDSNDGSESAPFLTLQKAMDRVGGSDSSYKIIFAAEGDYNKGGDTIASSQGNGWTLTNRLCVASGIRYVRVKGAGIGKSFISGASMYCVKGESGKTLHGSERGH